MNPTLITDLLTYALPSGFLAGTVTWLVSRRKRRNDMLADMQRSIDLLCEKYNDVLQENVTLRREIGRRNPGRSVRGRSFAAECGYRRGSCRRRRLLRRMRCGGWWRCSRRRRW